MSAGRPGPLCDFLKVDVDILSQTLNTCLPLLRSLGRESLPAFFLEPTDFLAIECWASQFHFPLSSSGALVATRHCNSRRERRDLFV